LERLMDHFGVAKSTTVRRQGFPGKRKRLDLSSRIDKLPRKIGTQDYSKILHALRDVGNLGTHGGNVNRKAMLDAYKLCEIALGKLFEDESDSVDAIIKRLKRHKKVSTELA
jgi:hypothetical protein